MSTELKVIDSLDGFHALKKEWNELFDECPNTTIFSSWDWMYTWWEVFHGSLHSDLFILGLYQDNHLIGIAPFHIINSFPKSLIQGKTLTFIGSGENCKDKIVSQYSDFLVKSDKQHEMIKAVSDYLVESKNKWDFADFEFLLEDSLISRCFKSNDSKIQTSISQYGNRFYIPEMKDFDDFQDKMGNRWSKMYKKKLRKLQNEGDIKIECSNNIESIKNAFYQLSQMHEARWKDRTGINIFKSSLFNDFHLKILERLVPQGKVTIKTLSLDNKPLSSYYYFNDKSQVHYYQSGFYSKDANKFSPLFLLICMEIGTAIKNKSLFDFMFDEDSSSYKKEQYAAQAKPMYRLMWSPHKSRMIKYAYAKKIQSKYLNFKISLLTFYKKIKNKKVI